ncbi:MAG: SUMF1/EgtB/PvdO family nonheme iron enzyme [bacterium]
MFWVRAPLLLCFAVTLVALRGPARADVRSGRLSGGRPKPAKMITVPGGWFRKGTTMVAAHRALKRFERTEVRQSIKTQISTLLVEETPERRIYVSTFRIDRLEVTRAEYRRCVARGRCKAIPLPSKLGHFRSPRAPMINVTWHEAVQYCQFVGKRLPTEAEWEKAARGPLGRSWPWGDRWHERGCNHGTIHPVQDMFHGSATDGFFWIAPVGRMSRDRSFYGVLDLAGNAAEWVADWYRFRHWSTGKISRHNPTGPSGGHGRLVKGGSWRRLRIMSRAAAKRWLGADKREPDVGFRCARR